MKKIGLILTVMVFSLLAVNAEAKESYTKEFNKEYKVDKDALLKLNNKYGNIACETWGQNKVAIKVVIEVYESSQKRGEELLEKFDVEFSGSSDMVSAMTKIQRLGKGNKKFSVDYFVKLPKTLRLDIENKYGNVFIPVMEGGTNLTVKYGDLQVEKLLSSENFINVKYGELNADVITEARIDFGYSDLSIDEIQVLDLKSSYSEISIDRVKNLELNTGFDDVEIGQVETLNAKSSYSDIEIDYLVKDLDLESNFGDISVDRIDKDFSNVSIESDYAGVTLSFDDGASFDAEVYVKYGDFHSKYRSGMDREKVSSSSYRYTGKVGGSAKSKVSVDVSFASVEIR